MQWTNASVVAFAGGQDPVAAMETRARELVLSAMDGGWIGPPFDPLWLAEWLNIQTEARGDIPDARMVPVPDGTLRLQYNPSRPRGRLRFSIAHEIAHSLFPDCAEEVRNRNVPDVYAKDNWQLEALCNIGAAELLMPFGSVAGSANGELSIKAVMDLRERFQVSVEASIIRLVKLARSQCAAFCASKHANGHYQIDYVIPSLGWTSPVDAGQRVPDVSAILEANAIGFMASGDEQWGDQALRVECVGLAPYPGSITPRVVGLFKVSDPARPSVPMLNEVKGNALRPGGRGPKLLAHVVPNTPRMWGGGGFASAVRRTFPEVWAQYKSATIEAQRAPELGQVIFTPASDDLNVANMVAQDGIGKSKQPRLMYAAFVQCLVQVRQHAEALGASVHMPRVGTGHGGASWPVVKELITEELVDRGIPTTVYELAAE